MCSPTVGGSSLIEHGVFPNLSPGRIFRDHWHVDRYPVAALDALPLQNIGEAANFLVQLFLRDVFGILGIVALPNDRRLIAALRQMPVNAIHADVERATFVPTHVQIFRVE